MSKIAAALCRSMLRAIGVCGGWLHHLILRAWRQIIWQIRMRVRIPPAALVRLAVVTSIFGGGGYLLVSGGYLTALAQIMLADAGLIIENVDIKGQKETSKPLVLKALQLEEAPSLATFDVWEARERLQTLPWVRTARVRKIYPNGLGVQLEERRAHARWQNAGRTFLIDNAGQVIAPLTSDRYDRLPLVVGEGADRRATALLAALAQHPAVGRRMSAAVFIGERRWDLMFDNGLEVKLPETGLAQALGELARLEKGQDLFKRDIVAVDLRLPDRLLLRLPEGARDGAADTRRGLELSRVGAPI